MKRADSGLYALPGGFVEVGESVESATLREVLEETALQLSLDDISQFRFYSDPTRDHRRHTASSFHICSVNLDKMKTAKSGDDAKDIVIMPLYKAALLENQLAFDHGKIIHDFIKHTSSSLLKAVM